ncbi:MAG: AAA family ATPase [Chloroflexi bacterium]|nr:AAA family ATPase [Chloroflexota bacterium]
MPARPLNSLRLSDYDLWLIARCVSGFPVSPDMATRESFDLLADLQMVTPDWRKMTLAQRWPEVAKKVQFIDPTAPAPAQPHIVKLDTNLIKANDLKYLIRPEYALSEYAIYQRGFNALVGPSGAGKSFVALDIAAIMATAGAGVIYVAGEGLHGFSGRWEAWKVHHQKDSDTLVFFKRAVNLMDATDTTAFITEVRPHKPQMVVIDTVARCMIGADENSTKDMGTFVTACDQIMRELDCGMLLVHHTGKDGKMRGNTALYAACDSVLFLQRMEQQIGVYNTFEQGGKNKHLAESEPRYLQLIPKSVQVDGVTLESAVLVEAGRVVNLNALTDPPTQNGKRVLEAIEGYESGLAFSAIQDATGISKSTLHRTLKSLMKSKHVVFTDDRYIITESGEACLTE